MRGGKEWYSVRTMGKTPTKGFVHSEGTRKKEKSAGPVTMADIFAK